MIENTKNTLPIHLTGMENMKGQQAINSILDSMNSEIDGHKWTITTQDYTELKFEKYLESGATLTVDNPPKANIPIVGTHNGRKVYIGDLDVQGNLIISDLSLRDNVNTVAKSWEVRSGSASGGSLKGDWWNSESFEVGIRNPKALAEVRSIPNDIQDPVYGTTIYNIEVTTASGVALDTKTFEKTEVSSYVEYPTWETGDTQRFALAEWMSRGWCSIGSQSYFPQITTLNAKSCYSPRQYYGVFDWENGSSGRCKLNSYSMFTTFDAFYNYVAQYPTTNGGNGRGIMIPSWHYVNSYIHEGCTCSGVNIITRRFISEEFDKRNGGIVKVDITYRI